MLLNAQDIRVKSSYSGLGRSICKLNSDTKRVWLVAVGMVITDHPPHRSGRALLTHPAPTSGIWRKSVVPDKDVQS